MRQTKISGIKFSVDNYVEITCFKDLINNKENPYIIAAIIAYVEGIINSNKTNDYYSFANMYKVKCKGNYMFLNIYKFIKNNENAYNYIMNYFNLWHNNNYEEFSYDEFNKNDLSNNFYELVSLLYEERNVAVNLKDNKEAEAYAVIINNLYELLENIMVL